MPRLLLDSHILIWWAGNGKELSEATRASIANASAEVFVSAASIWELGIKRSLGKLNTPDDYLGLLRDSRFTPLPITAEHALAAYALPNLHKDPFDRMLVAQAMVEAATLVTADGKLAEYGVPVVLA